MNLHSIVSSAIGAVNPNQFVEIRQSVGNTKSPDGTTQPAYATPGSHHGVDWRNISGKLRRNWNPDRRFRYDGKPSVRGHRFGNRRDEYPSIGLRRRGSNLRGRGRRGNLSTQCDSVPRPARAMSRHGA